MITRQVYPMQTQPKRLLEKKSEGNKKNVPGESSCECTETGLVYPAGLRARGCKYPVQHAKPSHTPLISRTLRMLRVSGAIRRSSRGLRRKSSPQRRNQLSQGPALSDSLSLSAFDSRVCGEHLQSVLFRRYLLQSMKGAMSCLVYH